MSHPLAGVYAASVTPLQADFSPSGEAIPPLLDFLARRGCHGVLLLGTTGEGPSFSPEERLEILRRALEVRTTHPDLRLLAGTGTPSLSETAALTRAAFDLGYDGVVVLPPYYFRNASDEGLFHYFESLFHQAVPADGFLLGYHFPNVAGIGFSLDLLRRLKEAFPVQFAGIKDSSHDPDLARSLGERFGSDLLVLTGTDSYLQLALENQAGGCITAPANLLSPGLRRLWDACQHGEDGAPIQEAISAQRHILEGYLPFPPILKALLHELHGFPRWPVRPPLVAADPERIAAALAELITEEKPSTDKSTLPWRT
ncbi:MAG: dihydrodipicolinate synthase family protein [Anaerolineales bacterium]|nr:dihydrodipicolinate synthase family protein [Anaerolineales bacterium]